MYIIRDERTNRVFFGKERTMLILCGSRRAAESAVRVLHARTGIRFTYDRVDRSKTAGFWFLRRRNGRLFGPENGVRVAFKNKRDAWAHAGSIFLETSKLLTPIPA